jgi:peptidoglycan/LPS O-acetylase OafA/YrhL
MQNTVFLKDSSESTPPAHAARTFRLDINGLRAWAVIAVVLFHFRALEVRGGFVGVDVFFVISGFLMTAIAVRGLEQGNFSILTFILARAQRILPALLVLVATLIVMGYFFWHRRIIVSSVPTASIVCYSLPTSNFGRKPDTSIPLPKRSGSCTPGRFQQNGSFI